MGHVVELLHDTAAPTLDETTDRRIARYVSNLAEDERRYLNRRRARSVSIAHARDVLFLRSVEELAARAFRGRITPRGYSRQAPGVDGDRIANLDLSDLHIGASLSPDESPESYAWTEAARRLAFVVDQAAEYKTRYRDRQTLHVYLNGDLFEGFLEHDRADGFPLSEQFVATLRYLAQSIAYLSSAYRSVHVWVVPGNHGRNKLRHPGRATTQKWDSYETMLAVSLREACSRLANVTFHISKAPAVVVPLLDGAALLTHGDTELAIGDPDTRGRTYEIESNRINGNRVYGRHIDLFVVGHWHKGRILRLPRTAWIVNGPLVPSNGHARTHGYHGACGQWLWESVIGHPLGDARFIEVGTVQDQDATLDRIVTSFDGVL
jgi:UDP-2,3-diacylglucosamine pyrophosphatase LpxH